MYYKDDRNFTDKMHKKYAIPFIYNKLKWKEQNIEDKLNEYQDIFSAIDYEFLDEKDCKILVQERFRKSNYSEFNDFTIRYERPENMKIVCVAGNCVKNDYADTCYCKNSVSDDGKLHIALV